MCQIRNTIGADGHLDEFMSAQSVLKVNFAKTIQSPLEHEVEEKGFDFKVPASLVRCEDCAGSDSCNGRADCQVQLGDGSSASYHFAESCDMARYHSSLGQMAPGPVLSD
jgi:hypothetical protein